MLFYRSKTNYNYYFPTADAAANCCGWAVATRHTTVAMEYFDSL